MANLAGVFVATALVATGWLSAQSAEDPPSRLRIPYLNREVALDGRLDEWAGAKTLRLNKANQVAHLAGGPAWRGVDDLSATVHLAYDAAHFYIAAEVLDDEFVRERDGSHWHQGDAIELFFDLNLDDDRNVDRGTAVPFDEDDLQIFLMPLNPVRSWGIVAFETGLARGLPGGSAMTGVRVAHQVQPGRGYTVEAVIPFHNLPGFELGTREVGFNVAIDDCDGESRYVYMTWTGERPVHDTRHLRPLEFAGGRGPLEPGLASGTDFYQRIRDVGPYLLWPLLVLLAGALCLRAWGWASGRHVAVRVAGQALGVVLLALGLLLPGWLTQLRAFEAESDVASIVDGLEMQLPVLEEGTLGSYRGGERDGPFVDLLSGRDVPRVRTVTHESLVELASDGFGRGPRPYPDIEAFPVQPYWIPLNRDQTEQLSFDPPLEGAYLNVVLARPAFTATEPDAGVRISQQFADAEAPVVELFDLDRQTYTSCREYGYPEREMVFAQLQMSEAMQSLSLTAAGVHGLHLVGLTLVPSRDEAGRPLSLGQASLGGVETELRGGYPEESGIRLSPGASAQVVIEPEKARPFESLWLFYKADYPGSDMPLPFRGEKVCEVELRFAGTDSEPKTIEFYHQESMFFELAHNNPDPEPSDPLASVAFRWEDDDGEQHLTLGYEVALPADAVVESIHFRSAAGSYPIHFRSAVFRDSQPTVRGEPADSPLELTESRQEVRLKEESLARLRGADFALYRSGSLEESTAPRAPLSLPPGLERALSPGEVQRRVVTNGDARAYEAYFPLPGEGWSGAVLGVSVADAGHGDHVRWVNRLGVLLCLLSVPVLLLLFGELLAVLHNLRFRLMAALTVAAIVPLAVLSIVLVRVLESGHESRMVGGMQASIEAASGRLAEQQRELLDSARAWLDSLVEQITEGQEPGVADPAVRAALLAGLEETMASQKPPEWDGGFLRLEVSSQETELSLTAFAGDPALKTAETPLRRDPGIYLSWGIPFVGVRWEREVPSIGLCSLSVGRPVDRGLLRGLSPGRSVVLFDTRGYPLGGAAAAAVPTLAMSVTGSQPGHMNERRDALTASLDSGQPVVTRHRSGGQSWIAGYDVLRDLEDTPRALLGVLDTDQAAVLPLALGAIPVRTFFLAVGGLLLLLAGFLSIVVTARISKPIERLESGARALSRGEFNIRVETEEGGQIGRLTHTFNRMARELHGRMQDMNDLNRGIQDLSAKLDLKETVTSVIGFCARHSSSDQVRVMLRDPERDRVEVFGGSVELLDPKAPDVEVLLTAAGPMSMRLRGAVGDARRELPRRFVSCRSLVALPLVMAGRTRGAILLMFDRSEPSPVQLELLTTMAAQTAASIENARLYLHAVEDAVTGAFLPDYFRRRVAVAVEDAQERGRSLALFQVSLVDGERVREMLGAGRFDELIERVAGRIRTLLPSSAMLCRSTDDSFQGLMFDTDAAAARSFEAELRGQVDHAEIDLPSGPTQLRVGVATASFPEEAASAEFLFHALDHQHTPAGAEPHRERMRELRAEGFTLQSAAMERLFRTLERVAPTGLTVLLEGETGTGKELLTNLIHRWSKRADGPLIKVHCAALSESLLQSELFGHEKGAFTGAVSRKIGRFEQAEGGTVFLDEIGEVSLNTQVKLLRVLQEREIDRVGGLEPVPVDVRVVAATNRNIREMVAKGTFREDLYYRLQGMVVTVPPLRERKREIPALVELFREEAAAAGQTRVERFHPDAMDELFRRDWPGNIRELRNAVFRSMVLASGTEVRLEDLLGILPPPGGELRQPVIDHLEPVVPAPIDPPPVAPAASSGRLAELMRLIDERGSITTQEYVELAGVSKRTGLRDLTQLVDQGEVERIGKRRGARYRRAGA